jgi:release factor glutamine methyltransferase
MSKRILSPYEKNILTKNHFDLNNPLLQTDIPVEYLVGKAQFRDHEFFVTKDTLIPRIETEELVDLALGNVSKNYSPNKEIILTDLCTGSGCIGISLALELIKKNYNFHIYFADISPKALQIAQKNFEHLLPNHQGLATFIESDLFASFPKDAFIDLVVSNPPYIPSQRIGFLDNSVKNYEPIIALDGGEDGLSLINKIISQLPKIQNNKVNAILEIDEEHNLKDIKKSEGLNPSLIKDSFGKNRFLSLLFL